jgi:hypothetical protein
MIEVNETKACTEGLTHTREMQELGVYYIYIL